MSATSTSVDVSSKEDHLVKMVATGAFALGAAVGLTVAARIGGFRTGIGTCVGIDQEEGLYIVRMDEHNPDFVVHEESAKAYEAFRGKPVTFQVRRPKRRRLPAGCIIGLVPEDV